MRLLADEVDEVLVDAEVAGHLGVEGRGHDIALSDRDRVTGKVIYNEGEFRLSTRLSFNQYLANPYQQGCDQAATAAAGCGTISVLANGINGTRIAHFDNTGATDHFPVNKFSLYSTSKNAMDVTVIVSAEGAAVQTATVKKDAGGAENPDE